MVMVRRPPKHKQSFTPATLQEEDLLDAMCLWEAMIDHRQTDQADATDFSKTWEAFGTWQMRQFACDMLPTMRSVFTTCQPIIEDSLAYDWEYVPLFLSCVRWPNVEASARSIEHPDYDVDRIVAEITARIALKAEPSLS